MMELPRTLPTNRAPTPFILNRLDIHMRANDCQPYASRIIVTPSFAMSSITPQGMRQ